MNSKKIYIDDSNKIIHHPQRWEIDNYNVALISEKDFQKTLVTMSSHEWYYIKGRIENLPKPGFDSSRQSIEQEILGIEMWLAENDWKVNKIILGEWSQEDSRTIHYLQERSEKRARHDELESKLNN